MATLADLQQQEKTLTQRLQERRGVFDQANQEFGTRASEALKVGGQPINPGDVFGQFNSFQRAAQDYVSPLEQQLSQLRSDQMDVQKLGLAERSQQVEEKKLGLQFNPETGKIEFSPDQSLNIDDLLKTRKSLVDQGIDTSSIDSQLKSAGFDVETGDKEKEDLISIIDELLAMDTRGISGIFKFKGALSGEKVKAQAKFDQLKAKLSLENREKLKGTGTISDFEAKILEKAATALTTDLRDKDFVAELKKTKADLLGAGELTGTEITKEDEDLINKYKNYGK